MPPTFTTTRFDIRREIGKGGMGVVYAALDRERNLEVALKVIREVSSETLHSFKQEFRSIADIVHPNLIGLHELFAEDDQWFFTMELIEGEHFLPYVSAKPHVVDETPSGLLTPSGVRPGTRAAFNPADELTGELTDLTAGPLEAKRAVFEAAKFQSPAELVVSHQIARQPVGCDVERLRHVLQQVAQGLAAVHSRGKLHRDIKSSNVMVTGGGRAVILDFGLASTIKELNRMRARGMVGTLAYSSPEQTLGEMLTPASDWYSVGVMMFEALTGYSPFMGETESLLERKLTTPPPPLEELVEDVPEDLNALCNALLRIDPVLRPAGREVLNMLNAGAATTYFAGSTPSAVDFIGRQRELATLNDALNRARAGRAAVALVSGPSGFGKSSLVQKFLGGLSSRDTLVLRGRCYEQESVPYKGIDNAIDTLAEQLDQWKEIVEEASAAGLKALVHVSPVLQQSASVHRRAERGEEILDPQMRRRAAFQCLRGIIAGLQRHRQIVFCIDDMQWTDAESVQLLSSLLAAPGAPAVLYLTSYRSEYEERNPWLQQWLEVVKASGAGNFPVSVGAFSPEESEELAASILGTSRTGSGLSAQKIVGEGEGNPFFIYQLAQSAREQGAKTQALAERITLETVLRQRVATLPASARDLLEVIAVAGRPIAKADAYAAAGLAQQDPVVLNILRIANLTRSFSFGEIEVVETYHDRIRETVANSLPREQARWRHEAVALQLEGASYAEPETLAVHFEAAENLQRAAHYYEMAANRAAAVLAFDKAARFYQKVLSLGEFTVEARRAVRLQLAEALVNAGRGMAAAEEYDSLSQDAGSARALEFETRAGFLYTSTGHLDQGLKVYDRVVERLGLREPKSRSMLLVHIAARLLALKFRGVRYKPRKAAEIPSEERTRIDTTWSLSAGLVLIDIPRSMNFALMNLRAALSAGEPERLLNAIYVSCYIPLMANIGGRAMSERLLQIAAKLADEVNTPRAHAVLEQARASVAHSSAEWVEALVHLRKAEQYFRQCTGVSFELAALNTMMLYTLGTVGDYAELWRRAESTIKEADEMGDLYSSTVAETFAAPTGQMALDHPAEARRHIERGLGRWKTSGYDVQNAMAFCATAVLAFYEGKGAAALPYIEREWQSLSAFGFARHPALGPAALRLWFRAALQSAALPGTSAEERKRLLGVAGQKLKLLKKSQGKVAEMFHLVSAAELANARGDLEAARAGFEHCERKYAELGMKPYAAALGRHRGEALGGVEGSELVREADEKLRACGIANPARMAGALMEAWVPSEAQILEQKPS